MYVAPNSIIHLIKGVKIDANYTNTIYFSTQAEQQQYFSSKVDSTLDEQSYVRKTRGVIRVNMPISSVYGVSYLMYRNSSFENKWFYAFVTDYEYVNNETTEIYFRLDVIQTYLFDVTPLQCMVDRMHSVFTDIAGDNLIPENLDTGEYNYTEHSQDNDLILWQGDWDICVFTTLNNDGSAQSTVDGQIMGGLYSGLNMYRFQTAAQVNAYLTRVSQCGAEASVVSICMIPRALLDLDTDTYDYTFNFGDMVGDYRPRNKKLLTAPWRGLYVTNGQGGVASYSYEYFNTFSQGTASFRLSFSLGANSDCMLQPVGYKGGARQFGVELTAFPQCAYTTDAYKSWLARNAGYLTLNQTTLQAQNQYQNLQASYSARAAEIGNERANAQAALGTGGSLLTGAGRGISAASAAASVGTKALGAAGALLGMLFNVGQYGMNKGFNDALLQNTQGQISAQIGYNNAMLALQLQNLMQQKHIAEITPPSFHGQSIGSASKLNGDFGYHVGEYHAKEQFVERADTFMDLFGYKQNGVLVPFRKARKHWTYLKTAGAAFENRSVPEDDFTAIEAIYDGGLRWWTNGDEIGDYIALRDDNACLANPEV